MRTFQVSEVAPSTRTLAALAADRALARRLLEPDGDQPYSPKLEAGAANLALVAAPDFADESANPLLEAVHTAFSDHHRLTLSPDDIWLCLAQGFARHVEANAEALRGRFVRHAGKVKITVIRDEFMLGSPDNDWPGCFAQWSDELATHIGKQRDLVVADFSTTGPIERAASEIVLMSAMRSYIDYELVTRCGIPEITLLGSVADWQSIRRRAEVFAEYDLGDWVRALLPVLDRFVEAAQGGNTERAFWQSIYHLKDQSGGPYVTGWINVLFPYLDDDGEVVPNRHALAWEKAERRAPTLRDFPCGLSRVPLSWKYHGRDLPMNLVAGFVGVAQDAQTHAVRPSIGWAVHHARG